MYLGDLFKKRVRYAELRDLEWGVLSAKYGLWWPNETRPVYDLTLNDLGRLDLSAWHLSVTSAVLDRIEDDDLDPRRFTIEIHAGLDYTYPLSEHLKLCGFNVELPCEGLGIGRQKQLYTSGALSPKALEVKPV